MNTSTEEKNKVLAELLEWPSDDEKTFYISDGSMPVLKPFGQYEAGNSFGPEELQFHTSYDWIAPVAIKCMELQIFGSQSLIDDIQSAGARFELGQLHEACYQFALRYKENSQS